VGNVIIAMKRRLPRGGYRDEASAAEGWMRRSVIIAGAAALAIGGAAAALTFRGSTALRIDAGDASLVAAGRPVYDRHCAACHGKSLEGQPNWRERLPNGRLPAPPHNAEGHTWHHPDRQLFQITKLGPSAIVPGYESDMPAFDGVLSDREIRAALAYIKSTWPAELVARQARLTEADENSRRR
jgi:mono/diheme cytochrome c family protein